MTPQIFFSLSPPHYNKFTLLRMSDSEFTLCSVLLFCLSLELSEKAKQDLMEFEEQERQKRQNRYGGRGRGGGRGGRGRGGFPAFGMVDFRGGNRGRMNDQRPPLMGNMGKLVSHCTVTYLNNFKGIIYLATVSKASLSTAPLLFKSRWRERKGFTG